MKKSFRHTAFFTTILLIVAGLAYYGAKFDWLGDNQKAPPGVSEKTSITEIKKPAPLRIAIKTLDEDKAKFADLLAGNWPTRLQTDTEKRNFVRGFLRSGEFDPKDISALIAMLHDAPESPAQQMIISELLARIAGNIPPNLGGDDPLLAIQLLDYLSDPAARRQMLGTALSRMAAEDPRAAWDELAKFPPGSAPPGVFASIFSSFAKQDPANAAATAMNLPASPERDNALKGVAQAWLKTNPQAAMNWALNLPTGNTDLVNGMIQSLASSNPTLAESYIGNISYDSARNDAIALIGRKLATGQNPDPAAALAWYNQAANGTNYANDVAQLFKGLTSPKTESSIQADGTMTGSISPYTPNIPLALSMLANVTDPSALQSAITSIADGWSKSDPQAALTWVANLPDGDAPARKPAIDSIMSNWLKSNPEAAVSFAQNSSNPAVFLPDAPQIASAMAQSNPQAALTWANNLPDGSQKTQAISNVLVDEAASNLTAAWNTAASLPSGATQDSVITNLVGAEAKRDPSQAATLVQQMPAGSAQLNATTTLASTWVKQDPQAFTVWLNTLPAGDVRDTAIAQLAASSQAQKDPASVTNWVNTVSNPQKKATLLQKLSATQPSGNN